VKMISGFQSETKLHAVLAQPIRIILSWEARFVRTFYLTGELALSSQLRPVKGVLSIALEAKRRHCRASYILNAHKPEDLSAGGVKRIPRRFVD
jgi:predicted ATPase with chaperone activity